MLWKTSSEVDAHVMRVFISYTVRYVNNIKESPGSVDCQEAELDLFNVRYNGIHSWGQKFSHTPSRPLIVFKYTFILPNVFNKMYSIMFKYIRLMYAATKHPSKG